MKFEKAKNVLQHLDAFFERIGYVWALLLVSLLLLAVIAPLNPQLLASYVWAASKIAMAAAGGYVFDWVAFRHNDPDNLDGIEMSMARNRRATLIGCALIAVGLIG